MQKIQITTNHTGKMQGMQSLSTACTSNEICRARAAVPGSVCAKCYAARQLAYQSTTREKMERNAEVLREPIPAEAIPKINAALFRFEAFGDVATPAQVENYFRIAAANKRTRFALWTKNAGIVAQAIRDGAKKPANLVIIYSSPLLNKPSENAFKVWGFIDKVFTVYDEQAIKRGKININCGARNCLECGKCYNKSGAKFINEKLK